MNNQFLLALCGIPASGKTTLAKQLYEVSSVNENVRLISTDKWRDQDYYADFLPEREQEVRRKALDATRIALTSDESVIHDDTNYYSSMRHELYSLASERQCKFGIVFINTPLDVSLQWNEKRDVMVPSDVITRINERLDKPGAKYAWDNPIYQVDLNSVDVIEVSKEILGVLKTLQPIQKEQTASIGIAEKYDKATREIVGKFLTQKPKFRQSVEVSRIRRKIMHQALEKEISLEETRRLLLEELSKFTSESS
ncbi:MAG: AAA family ATPase [Candidatus Thorarchaeota archaeon]|nr:AAA family ATPase [Candidatus Thorarchaeota archaeon]